MLVSSLSPILGRSDQVVKATQGYISAYTEFQYEFVKDVQGSILSYQHKQSLDLTM